MPDRVKMIEKKITLYVTNYDDEDAFDNATAEEIDDFLMLVDPHFEDAADFIRTRLRHTIINEIKMEVVIE